MDCKESIKEFCKSLGLELVGFTGCRLFSELQSVFFQRKARGIENEFEEQDIEKRINPFNYMKDGKTIISIAFPYFHGQNSKQKIHFSKYTLAKDYHVVLSAYLEKICSHIETLGGKALYFADNNSLPERYIAYLSGIGFIGKNNTLITKEYGSYVFLGEIITDLEIEEDKPMQAGCGSCKLCADACPSGSLVSNNPNLCLSFITQKKDIDDQWFSLLNGRLFGCDTCQEVCPYNHRVKESLVSDFAPLSFMEHPDIMELISLNNKTFDEKYRKTAAGWRGKSILQRNALINLFYSAGENMEPLRNLKFASPRLQDIYNRLLRIFKL